MHSFIVTALLVSMSQLVASFVARRTFSCSLRLSLKASNLELSEDNVLLVLEEMRFELGTIFGYNAQSKEVGITGEIFSYCLFV